MDREARNPAHRLQRMLRCTTAKVATRTLGKWAQQGTTRMGGDAVGGKEMAERISELSSHVHTGVALANELCKRKAAREEAARTFSELRRELEDKLRPPSRSNTPRSMLDATLELQKSRVHPPDPIGPAQAPWANSNAGKAFFPKLPEETTVIQSTNAVQWRDSQTSETVHVRFAGGSLYRTVDGRCASDCNPWGVLTHLTWNSATATLTDQNGYALRNVPREVVEKVVWTRTPPPLQIMAAKAGVTITIENARSVIDTVKEPGNDAQMEFADSTNLCLLFQAFQPFLDRNAMSSAEVQSKLGDVKLLSSARAAKAIAPFVPPHTMLSETQAAAVDGPFMGDYGVLAGRAKEGKTRRRLMLAQQYDEDGTAEEGGIPDARMTVMGRHGLVAPGLFVAVLQHLADDTIDPLLLRALYDYFSRKNAASEPGPGVNVREFLDSLDDVLQSPQVREEWQSRIFSLVSTDGCTVSRTSLLGPVIRSGALTAAQAYSVIDHLPQAAPDVPATPSPARRRSRRSERRASQLRLLEHRRAQLDRWKQGPTISKEQFLAILDESPYLFNTFINVSLRCLGNYYGAQLRKSSLKDDQISELAAHAQIGSGRGVFVHGVSPLQMPAQKRPASRDRDDGGTDPPSPLKALSGQSLGGASVPDILSETLWEPKGMPQWLRKDLPAAVRGFVPLLRIVGPVWDASGDAAGPPVT
eukprot:TRINITY_DN1499_c0_g2_i1.p1 TRINITY_DN1499_c0_g2~~TRINITY_DN1499_c0_g2_i1.p1  ORF type:complete len:700 (+),score=84.78 TRINITY_DN1499_c0_g2_i1:91-2190(+)